MKRICFEKQIREISHYKKYILDDQVLILNINLKSFSYIFQEKGLKISDQLLDISIQLEMCIKLFYKIKKQIIYKESFKDFFDYHFI